MQVGGRRRSHQHPQHLTKIRVVGTGLAFALIACSANIDDFDDISSGGGVSFDSGSSTANIPEPEQVCDQVRIGESCSEPDECEIGSQVNASCNDYLSCMSGEWTKVDAGSCVTDGCPSTYGATPPQGTCDAPNALTLRCEYDEGTCGCAVNTPPSPSHDDDDAGDGGQQGDQGDTVNDAGDAGDAGLPNTWKCIARSEGCPRVRPRVGTTCVRPIECDYGQCIFQGKALYLQCDTNKFWTDEDQYGVPYSSCNP